MGRKHYLQMAPPSYNSVERQLCHISLPYWICVQVAQPSHIWASLHTSLRQCYTSCAFKKKKIIYCFPWSRPQLNWYVSFVFLLFCFHLKVSWIFFEYRMFICCQFICVVVTQGFNVVEPIQKKWYSVCSAFCWRLREREFVFNLLNF